MPLSHARLLHSDESLTVQLLPGLRCLLNTWSGFSQGEAYRSRMNLVIDLLEGTSARSVIANVQEFRPLISADQEWTNVDWAPRVVAAGLKHMAVVQPLSVFSQLVVTNVVNRIDADTMQVVQVAQIADALRWLESFPA